MKNSIELPSPALEKLDQVRLKMSAVAKRKRKYTRAEALVKLIDMQGGLR
jgi:hypothetical protein